MKKNNYLESLNTKFIQHEYINKPHECNSLTPKRVRKYTKSDVPFNQRPINPIQCSDIRLFLKLLAVRSLVIQEIKLN